MKNVKRFLIVSCIILLSCFAFMVPIHANYNTILSNETDDALMQSTDGWLVDENGILKTDADGYYVYYITENTIIDNKIVIDFKDFIELIWSPGSSGINGSSSKQAPVKIVNTTDYTISYADYSANSDSIYGSTDTHFFYPLEPAQFHGLPSVSDNYVFGEVWNSFFTTNDSSISLPVKGFDDKYIRLSLNPMRSLNSAIYALYEDEYRNATGREIEPGDFPVLYLCRLDEKIKGEITFETGAGQTITLQPDSSRTYADYLKIFYGVSDFSELTVAQKRDIFGGPSVYGYPDGQTQINYFDASERYTPVSFVEGTSPERNYLANWAFSSLYGDGTDPVYAIERNFILESDPEVNQLGYQFLYENGTHFSFDNQAYPLLKDMQAGPTSAYSYILKTEENQAIVKDIFSSTLSKDQAYLLENVQVLVLVPNSWNQNRYYDFNITLTLNARDAIQQYEVIYHPNIDQFTGETIDLNSPYFESDQVKILENGFKAEGYTFLYWNTSSDNSGTAYYPNSGFAITDHVHLYAIWKKDEVDPPISPDPPTPPVHPDVPTGINNQFELLVSIQVVAGSILMLVRNKEKKKDR